MFSEKIVSCKGPYMGPYSRYRDFYILYYPAWTFKNKNSIIIQMEGKP